MENFSGGVLGNGAFSRLLQTWTRRWNGRGPNLQSNKKSRFTSTLDAPIDQSWMNPLARAEPPHTNDFTQSAEVYLIGGVREEPQKISQSFKSFELHLMNVINEGSDSQCFHFVLLRGKTSIDRLDIRDHTVHFCLMGRMPLGGLHWEISPHPWCKWDHRNDSSHTFVRAIVTWWSNRIMLKVSGVI